MYIHVHRQCVLRCFSPRAGNPSEGSLRTMKLVAKAVQNLANLVSFKTKEPFMTSLNPFIVRHMPDMIKFIDKLSVSLYVLMHAVCCAILKGAFTRHF